MARVSFRSAKSGVEAPSVYKDLGSTSSGQASPLRASDFFLGRARPDTPIPVCAISLDDGVTPAFLGALNGQFEKIRKEF
jgi:hypothetical protein